MGLALTACSGDDTGKTTPTSIAAIDYGSGILGTDTDTDADTDPSGDTGASSGTGRTP